MERRKPEKLKEIKNIKLIDKDPKKESYYGESYKPKRSITKKRTKKNRPCF
jgi:hypothetical protein